MSLDQTLQAAAEKYGVPPALLSAVGHQESGMNPKTGDSTIAPAVGSERAHGMMQIKPSTARDLGVDPSDPAQSLYGAAAYLRQGYDKFGNWDDAVRYYHGGPNTNIWKTRTQGYHEDIAARLKGAAAPAAPTRTANPFGDAGSAPAETPRSKNPFGDVNDGANPAGPDRGGRQSQPDLRRGAGNDGDKGKPAGPGGFWSSVADAVGDPITNALVNGKNPLRTIQDNTAGALTGIAKIPAGLTNLAAAAIEETGYGKKTAATLRRWAGNIQGAPEALAHDPNSLNFKGRELAGEGIALAPVSELAPFAAAGKVGKVAKIADLALQGGTAGAILSQGQDVGKNALIGAVAAPVAGAVIEKAAPYVIKGAEKLGASKLAQALKGRAAPEEGLSGGVVTDTSEAAPVQSIRRASDLPTTPPPAESGYNWNAKVGKWEPLEPQIDVQFAGDTAPAPNTNPTSADLAKALQSRDARSGVEAYADSPPEVTAHAQRLVDQGVSPAEAVREAEITAVGAKPTVASVTRDQGEQSALFEGAKQPTPEGRALAATLTENNARLHQGAQDIVENYGGVAARGEAAETAARSLAAASDAERAKVGQLYKAAEQTDGAQTVSVDPLRELLATPEFKAPTNSASASLIKGTRRLVKELSKTNGNRFTPEQIESLRQASNQAYDRMGGGVNHTVRQINKTLDESLDQLEAVSDAYKAARKAHKAWASKYENPKGISTLIKRDAGGNFIAEDGWRSAERFIDSMDDRHFVQIVRQLKANGDTQSLARMKATIVQRAYERATSTARDAAGNPTLNGKIFFQELDKIGKAKLQEIFTPDELAKIATIGRAARHMNEAVPGSVNTSGTASALIRALGSDASKVNPRVKMALRVGGHVVAGVTTPGAGNVAVEGATKGAEALSRRASAKTLAAGIREAMDPALSRANRAKEAQKIADAIRRRAVSGKIARRVAPIAAAGQEGRK